MAVRASAQQTIIDITDAYSVYLTCASYTFPGTTSAAKAGSAKTQVVAMRGTEQVTATVDTSKCEAPAGVTVTSDADATSPTLTVSVTTAVTAPGKVTIPVVVDGGVDFTLEFAFGIALTGAQGDTGAAGADAVTLAVISDNGTVFKNSEGSTTLTVHVYRAGSELSSADVAKLGTIRWYKDGGTTSVGSGATLSVSAASVSSKAVYTCQLEG